MWPTRAYPAKKWSVHLYTCSWDNSIGKQFAGNIHISWEKIKRSDRCSPQSCFPWHFYDPIFSPLWQFFIQMFTWNGLATSYMDIHGCKLGHSHCHVWWKVPPSLSHQTALPATAIGPLSLANVKYFNSNLLAKSCEITLLKICEIVLSYCSLSLSLSITYPIRFPIRVGWIPVDWVP
jgi:hypothetical protein